MNMPKRRRVSDNSHTHSILDYLNEDCWHYVLEYVPVNDIIRTERISQRWQGVILRYLQGISISILEKDDEWNKTHPNICYLESSKYKSFELWTDKLGSSVVAAVVHDDGNWEHFKAFSENCPNLESLKISYYTIHANGVVWETESLMGTPKPSAWSCFCPRAAFSHVGLLVALMLYTAGGGLIVGMGNYELQSFPLSLNKDFKKLQRLCFKSCNITDQCVQALIADKALEELKFYQCPLITGAFLDTLTSTNLKSLVFYECPEMNNFPFDRLGELTQLILWDVDAFMLGELYLELDKLPKLELLRLYSPEIVNEGVTHEPMSSLSRLKHMAVQNWLSDDDLEEVLQGCKELQTMELLDCQDMTSDAVPGMVKYGTNLTTVILNGYDRVTDDNVLTLIQGCPKLTSLTLRGSPLLSPALPARARAARRGGLRLRLDLRGNLRLDSLTEQDDCDDEMKEHYQEMMRIYNGPVIDIEP